MIITFATHVQCDMQQSSSYFYRNPATQQPSIHTATTHTQVWCLAMEVSSQTHFHSWTCLLLVGGRLEIFVCNQRRRQCVHHLRHTRTHKFTHTNIRVIIVHCNCRRLAADLRVKTCFQFGCFVWNTFQGNKTKVDLLKDKALRKLIFGKC